MKKTLIIFLTTTFTLWADSYHNINELIGERATGMGGAYTAISDDPSGIVYNPAGLSYAFSNSASVSANVYSEQEKRYQNVFGMGSDYVRKSRGLNPNFVGVVRKFGSFKVGFGLVNAQKRNFDQADQFLLPQTRPDLARYRVEYLEDNDQLMFGSGFAYPISEKLSIGASLFYQYNSERIVTNQTAEGFENNYTVTNIQDRRTSRDILPVLGIQYAPNEKLNLGFSMRRRINIGTGSRSVAGLVSGSTLTQFTQTTTYYNTVKSSALLSNGQIYITPTEIANLPELQEMRFGIAFFGSPSFRISTDLIYTTGFTLDRNRNYANLSDSTLILQSTSDPNMYHLPTLNYAFGLEYFVTNKIPIKFGYFTDFANTQKIDWATSALDLYLIEQGLDTINVGNNLQYLSIQGQPRSENVDIKGYTFGFGYETSTTSISFIYVYQYGKGNSQVDSSQLPQGMLFRNESVYIIASSFQ